MSADGRRKCPPWGLWGGAEGMVPERLLRQPGEPEFHRLDAQRHMVPSGTEALVLTAGGGGWGSPLEREPAKVQWDVLEGYISLDSARDDYGVMLDPGTLAIDSAATDKMRSRRSAETKGA